MSILGIDEVGRGPWAGPLVIGAAILPDRFDKNGEPLASEAWQDALTDSKKLTAKKREALAPQITEKAIATGLGWVPAAELDKIGLSSALKLATRRAVCGALKIQDVKDIVDLKQTSNSKSNSDQKLKPKSKPQQHDLPFTEIIIDGTQNFLKDTPLENLVSVLPKADAKVKEVSAASIIAKVARDNYMKELAQKYPGYGFENHVGYGTAAHKTALEKLGPCPEHRRSFAPVARLLENEPAKTASGDLPRRRERRIGSSPVTTGRVTGAPEVVTSARLSNKTNAGSRAEQIVADYLKSKGHTILARNHKTKFYEIDIVSATKDHIYFTEVKYRKNNSHGTPLEFIDKAKQKQITFAAESFMKYLSKKLNRPLDDLPSPILAAASVEGPNFELAKWLPIVV